jgi:DNA polymerase-3 subunit epsilon
MRQIIIDTETTGLDPKQGHRIIELAALEVANRRATGRSVHFRLDPEREIDSGATEVHGMTWDDLRDKPKFADVAAEFIAFASGAEWIIHNAPFDLAFLDAELARDLFPGKRNSLDALCERFGVDNAHRALHGALLDAELLADVYLTMTRGQETLTIDMAPPPLAAIAVGIASTDPAAPRAALVQVVPTDDELAAHRDYLAALEKETAGRCVWLRLAAFADADAGVAAQPVAAQVVA